MDHRPPPYYPLASGHLQPGLSSLLVAGAPMAKAVLSLAVSKQHRQPLAGE